MSDLILALDACLALFRWLPMVCLLTVLFLALASRAVGGRVGSGGSRVERLGFVAVPFGSTLALPMLVFWVCLRPSPLGGGSVAVISITGVLRCVCR